MSMAELSKAEPLEDIVQLSRAVMGQVQQYARSVITVWDGAVSTADFAVMQQGIVVHIEESADPVWSDIPAETLDQWRAGYEGADVAVQVGETALTDDVVFQLVQDVLTFIEKNPARSIEWRQKAEEQLAKSQPPPAAD